MTMKRRIQEIIKNALNEAKKVQKWTDFDMPEISVEYPKSEQFGDYTSNIAMNLAKKIGENPMVIASALATEINSQSVAIAEFEKIEVVKPGYLNFYLATACLQNVVEKIQEEQNNFGSLTIGENVKVDNEFISANPTGPLHLGNGRGGFFGDCLSRILRKAGYEVTNEYYVNDAGGQVEKLGHSVLKDEEAVYSGNYIDELNEKYGMLENIREVGKKAATDILENMIKKTTVEKMGIVFDQWVSEQELNDEGYVEKAIGILKEKGLTYEQEGALWLKSTHFGDDKDRVLIKKDGKNAYMAGDCGYMLYKIERGYTRLIMGLGADHHGYVSRLKAVALALGFKGDFRIIISQMVRLVKDGKEVRMSKRAGNVVDIDDLISEIGHDVTRFFFLMYSPDTHMNFDLGLAREQSQKNPVFYVQYAHARICSIISKAQELGVEIGHEKDSDLSLLTHEREISLMKEMHKFPELIAEIAESYDVHKLPHSAMKMADKLHSFYGACKVIDEEKLQLTRARLILIDSVRIILEETLRLIGVSAPRKM